MFAFGMNLAAVGYWAPPTFLDHIKACSGWSIKYATPNSVIGPDGWPIGAGSFQTMVQFNQAITNYTLIVLEGQVESLRVVGGNGATVTNNLASFDASTVPSAGCVVVIKATSSARTRVAIVETASLDRYNNGEVFRPQFIDFIAGSPMLRFMDWAHTNDTKQTAWTPVDTMTYHGRIIPIEHMVAACNATGADMWLNIPASIPLAEAQRVITLARSRLLPWIKLHVEWSNEVWNTAFPIGKVAAASPLGKPTYYAQQSAALAKALPAGVDLMLCWQWVGPRQMQKVIDAYKAAGGPWDKVYGLAFAPYPWNSLKPVSGYLAANDAPGLLADMEQNRAAQAVNIPLWSSIGKTNGKPIGVYEIGLQPNTRTGPELAFAKQAVQLPAAADIMRRLWNDLDAGGVSFGCHFNSAGGLFGSAPDYDAPAFPVRTALLDHNRRAWPMMRAGVAA